MSGSDSDGLTPSRDARSAAAAGLRTEDGLVGLIEMETQEAYATHNARSAYRAGMSTAAMICDDYAMRMEADGRKEQAEGAKLCGHGIWGYRERIHTVDAAAGKSREPAAYICDGCNRLTTDPAADIAAIRAEGGRSCCPERMMIPLYYEPAAASEAPISAEAVNPIPSHIKGETEK